MQLNQLENRKHTDDDSDCNDDDDNEDGSDKERYIRPKKQGKVKQSHFI